MTIEKIVEDMAGIMVEKLDIGKDMTITSESNIIELGMDSVALMTLWVYMEEHFGFTADEDVLFNTVFETIGDIAKYVLSKVEE